MTGFEPFPGAPVNPTQRLVAWLRRRKPAIAGMGAFRAEVLPVDYAAVGPRLSAIGHEFRPDVVIHFGLAQRCAGFRLERVARNLLSAARPDNTGSAPGDGAICAGPALLPSTLPLEAIHAALAAAGLPVEWSDDAGGYLCNMVFALSAAQACEGFAPRMTGFVHVPLIGPGHALGVRQFHRGAMTVLATTVEAALAASNR